MNKGPAAQRSFSKLPSWGMLALLFLLFFCDVHRGLAQNELEVHFSYRPGAFPTLQEHIDQVDIILPAVFFVNKSGVVFGEIESRVLGLGKEHQVKLMPQIKNFDANRGLFRKDWAHGVLTDPAARARTIHSMLHLCKKYRLWGMQVEFENVHIDDREALTAFYRAAAQTLHENGYKISISAVHRTQDHAGPGTYSKWMMENWRGAYDLKAFGKIGEFVKITSYAQHTRRTTPGPSQSFTWLEKVTQYFLRFIPSEKLSLGIAMGAYHYFTVANPNKYYQNARSWSRSISLTEMRSLLEQYPGQSLIWDPTQKTFFGFIERGGLLEWFFADNDVRSFETKLDLVEKYKLRAINCWFSGDEDPRMWERIKEFRNN
ncbi:hypothetical protein GWN42_02815 [candidate division KSB1 bacterium]|nr:hypothetical protein [candidate division KSB1 bacterium]NIS25505.1 hypothetical protein [candidate division KSB1 bacterium]NIU26182.1 hypothetical protein [candidate division KSB1 bacterium]NIU89601.1 hypothetical protein [candidate division KSB1 bacterium]NIV91744.1 hypothetical protein [candidate division KSB1 bacterium]